MPIGHPAGFGMTPAEFCEQYLRFERDPRRLGQDVRLAPLAASLIWPAPRRDAVKITTVTVEKWRRAWGMPPFPIWPRDFLDDHQRPVLVCIFDARPPFRIHWISPNCEDLLHRLPAEYIGKSARMLRTQPNTLWQQQAEIHTARVNAIATPGASFFAETTLAVTGDLELPIEWAIRYGQHRTKQGACIGTYFATCTQLAPARAAITRLPQPVAWEEKVTHLLADQNIENPSFTVGRDAGGVYAEVKGTLLWEELLKKASSDWEFRPSKVHVHRSRRHRET